MTVGRLLILTLLCASPVLAQPIIIPLEPQHKPEAPPPVASAPPVAPPIADPTRPETATARDETGQPTAPLEEAAQPPGK